MDFEQFFHLLGLGVVLKFVEPQYLFFHFVRKLDNVFPVFFHSLDKISILLPVFFCLDFIDGVKKLVDFAFEGFNLV
jgi:hypothetical protein